MATFIRFLSSFAALLLLIAIGIGGAWLILQQAAVAESEKEIVVTKLPVETLSVDYQETYEISRAFSGRVVARRSSDMGFERAGLVTEVLVDDGDSVAKGDVLAKLDIEPLQLQRRQLTAQRSEIQSRLNLAKLIQKRREELLKTKHSSTQEYDEARFETQAVAAQLERLNASIRSLDLDLKKSVLTAPFAGKIAQRFVDEGAVLNAGHVVVRLLESSVLEARIGLPSQFLADVPVGSTHQVRVNGQQRRATVSKILPNLDVNSRTISVVLTLDDTSIPPGELVHLTLYKNVAKSGIWLPTTALSEGLRGLWTVYALQDSEKAEAKTVLRREVEVLHTESDRVFVRGTLQDGDLIIANGTHRVVPGQLVQLQPQTKVAAQ